MVQMRVKQCVVGQVQTNCYFVINQETKETLIIDPGAESGKLIGIAEDEKLNPVAILLTHGHFDHAGKAEKLAEHFDIPIYAMEKERETLENPELNLSTWTRKMHSYHADCYLKDGEEFDLAGFHIRALHTPGHTEGGGCYFFSYQKVLFAGDTLFAQSVGRTDFPRGSMAELVRAIREKLMVLPDDVTVYPGHNETTTIGTERMYNPYL